MCGWTDRSINAAVYSWERRQRGLTLPDSGPSSDYTTGTATGTFHVQRLFSFKFFWNPAHRNASNYMIRSNISCFRWSQPIINIHSVHLIKCGIKQISRVFEQKKKRKGPPAPNSKVNNLCKKPSHRFVHGSECSEVGDPQHCSFNLSRDERVFANLSPSSQIFPVGLR